MASAIVLDSTVVDLGVNLEDSCLFLFLKFTCSTSNIKETNFK